MSTLCFSKNYHGDLHNSRRIVVLWGCTPLLLCVLFSRNRIWRYYYCLLLLPHEKRVLFNAYPLFQIKLKYLLDLQSKPCKMFAATLQPSWPSRPQTNGTLLFYFLKLYNFVFYEIFVGSTSSEVQHPWISKNHDGTKKIAKK